MQLCSTITSDHASVTVQAGVLHHWRVIYIGELLRFHSSHCSHQPHAVDGRIPSHCPLERLLGLLRLRDLLRCENLSSSSDVRTFTLATRLWKSAQASLTGRITTISKGAHFSSTRSCLGSAKVISSFS